LKAPIKLDEMITKLGEVNINFGFMPPKLPDEKPGDYNNSE
jgi:hypothetical protein